MRRMLIVAGVLGMVSAAPAAAQLTIGSHTFYQWTGAGANNHWYAMTTGGVNWWGGEAEADAIGSSPALNPFGALANGYLASLHSAAENSFIMSTFGTQSFHIGAFQPAGTAEPNSGWQWSSGEAYGPYTNWSGGEPNDLGGEDYVSMNWGGGGSWNDHNGTPGYRGMMEFEAIETPGTVTPEPVTMTLLGTGLAAVGAARRRRRQS
jgi:hypothetical protein